MSHHLLISMLCNLALWPTLFFISCAVIMSSDMPIWGVAMRAIYLYVYLVRLANVLLVALTGLLWTDSRPRTQNECDSADGRPFSVSIWKLKFHAVTLSKAGVPHKVKRKEPYRRGYVTIPEGKLPFCCGYSVSWQGGGEDGPWN